MAKIETVRIEDKNSPTGFRIVNKCDADKLNKKPTIITDAQITNKLHASEAKVEELEEKIEGLESGIDQNSDEVLEKIKGLEEGLEEGVKALEVSEAKVEELTKEVEVLKTASKASK